MYQPKSEYTKLALEVIVKYIKDEDIRDIENGQPSKVLSEKLACFVSIHLKDGSLRGCIGTIEPFTENLHQEIISNAISAATRDSRFLPLREEELEDIEISVDVLSKPEKINDIGELDPVKFGVIVSDGTFRRAVLLPALEGISTVEKQLEIVKRKAGLSDLENVDLVIKKFTSTRFY